MVEISVRLDRVSLDVVSSRVLEMLFPGYLSENLLFHTRQIEPYF